MNKPVFGMLLGSLLGLIVGYATFKYGRGGCRSAAAA